MKFNKKLIIPLLYITNREVYRIKVSKSSSIIRIITAMILNFLWVPIYALILLNKLLELPVYYSIFIYLVTFLLFYEIGYILSDNVSVRFETGKIRRKFFKKLPSLKIIGVSIFLRLVLIFGIFKLYSSLFYEEIVFIYLFTLFIFLIHCILKENYRIGTFIVLRILKGFVPYAFLLFSLSIEENLLVFSGLIGTAFFYAIEYSVRKLGGKIDMNFYSIKSVFLEFSIIFLLSGGIAVIFRIGIEKLLFFIMVLVGYRIFRIFLRILKNQVTKIYNRNNKLLDGVYVK